MGEVKDIGQMRYKITIEQPSESRGTAGGFTHSWSTLATVWAAKFESAATEGEESERQVNKQGVTWVIRYLSTVTPIMRISYGGQEYYITSVAQLDHQHLMEVKTELKK